MVNLNFGAGDGLANGLPGPSDSLASADGLMDSGDDDIKLCKVCGRVDDVYDENSLEVHEASIKHMCNKILKQFKDHRSEFKGDRFGAKVACSASTSFGKISNVTGPNFVVSVRPHECVRFELSLENETREQQMELLGVHLLVSQPQFLINDHGIEFGNDPRPLPPKSVNTSVYVTFKNEELGHFEMPIVVTFRNKTTSKIIPIVKTMVAYVEDTKIRHEKIKSPYTDEAIYSENLVHSTLGKTRDEMYVVPKDLKKIFVHKLKPQDTYDEADKALNTETRMIIDRGTDVANYVKFFHHLLWYEETVVKMNLKKYNMMGVPLNRAAGSLYELLVPGLAEKRPSVMKGDSIYVRPHANETQIYAGRIVATKANTVLIDGLAPAFTATYKPENLYDIRFILSRVPFERMHVAANDISRYKARVFPAKNTTKPKIKPIAKFFSEDIASNREQRIAVERIVAGTAGTAPYMVYGPPGTGKTVTIVEAILQLVKKDANNRILVCTDSNMAADHIACAIVKHEAAAQVPKLLFRANSQFRVWEVMPKELVEYSNGHDYDTFKSVNNATLSTYRIVVCTLSHAAKYSSRSEQQRFKLSMTHLFIDEAAQASEPACLIPIAGLLRPGGHLVLAGDPKQLGPVCVSKDAAKAGLGISLMERLEISSKFLYDTTDTKIDHDYITMLKNNFRSHQDIIRLPNELFYKNQLKAFAKQDPLSEVDILTGKRNSRAIVFHGVIAREQREGKSPSFYNLKEIEMLQLYVRELVNRHKVLPEDIGVVTPYIRQMFKIREWLSSQATMGYDKLEVGTVEAFQGKEKRVIIITTVRANCKLLDYDAKYQLGFLVDDKRFNVALTRAKAKAIIIGNPACLVRDVKWRKYMELCREFDTELGSSHVERTADTLRDIAVNRFKMTRISEELNNIIAKQAAEPKTAKPSKKNGKKV